jgi:hypothetical protein
LRISCNIPSYSPIVFISSATLFMFIIVWLSCFLKSTTQMGSQSKKTIYRN